MDLSWQMDLLADNMKFIESICKSPESYSLEEAKATAHERLADVYALHEEITKALSHYNASLLLLDDLKKTHDLGEVRERTDAVLAKYAALVRREIPVDCKDHFLPEKGSLEWLEELIDQGITMMKSNEFVTARLLLQRVIETIGEGDDCGCDGEAQALLERAHLQMARLILKMDKNDYAQAKGHLSEAIEILKDTKVSGEPSHSARLCNRPASAR